MVLQELMSLSNLYSTGWVFFCLFFREVAFALLHPDLLKSEFGDAQSTSGKWL